MSSVMPSLPRSTSSVCDELLDDDDELSFVVVFDFPVPSSSSFEDVPSFDLLREPDPDFGGDLPLDVSLDCDEVDVLVDDWPWVVCAFGLSRMLRGQYHMARRHRLNPASHPVSQNCPPRRAI